MPPKEVFSFKNTAICLMGPTASGKTELALSLARYLPLEIVNVDSAQIYQQMDIGSGKPDHTTLAEVPHHLMDFLDPALAYNAAQFCQDANACITAIFQRGNVPLLVGGTMLYFKALQQGLSCLPPADPEVRQTLTQWIKAEGLAAAYEKLQVIDPLSAQRIKSTDPQRIQRALEVYEVSGKPLSFWLAQSTKTSSAFHFINLALIPLTTDREVLHQRIHKRFEHMLAQGFVAEVQALMNRGDLSEHLPAIRAVGYRQIWQYLLGQCSYEVMQEKAIAATRQLAKRQLTWLRSWPELTCFDFAQPELSAAVLSFLTGK